jgi:hypothetical protein
VAKIAILEAEEWYPVVEVFGPSHKDFDWADTKIEIPDELAEKIHSAFAAFDWAQAELRKIIAAEKASKLEGK